jgi:hypothetical protein
MEWTFGDIFLTMLGLFFWFAFVWMFIGAFADVFRREDLSGWGKAGWLFVICVLPFFGVLMYMVTRPISAQERRTIEIAQAEAYPPSNYSPADEIAKLTKLHDGGSLTDGEYETLKSKVMA